MKIEETLKRVYYAGVGSRTCCLPTEDTPERREKLLVQAKTEIEEYAREYARERALEAVEIDKEKVGKIMSDFECDINEGVGLQEVLYREKPIKLKEEE